MDVLKTINQVKSNRQPSGLNDSRQHNVICLKKKYKKNKIFFKFFYITLGTINILNWTLNFWFNSVQQTMVICINMTCPIVF